MNIKSHVLNWLLEEENPSVRYRTLTELLDEGPGDARVKETKERILSSKPVAYIFSKMHPDGYWEYDGKGDGVDYVSAVTTHFNLAFLAELGLDRSHPGLAAAAERYLSLAGPGGDFYRHLSCLYAYNIRTFIKLGYGDDARVRKTVNLMLETERSDDGYLCDIHENKYKRRQTKSCYNGCLKALMAYAELPELWEHPRCLQLLDYFMRREVLFRNDDRSKLVNKGADLMVFPFTWSANLLETAYALSVMGYGNRPELEKMWKIFNNKKNPENLFILDWNPPKSYFKPGKRGQANKWVTLYAYLAIKHKNG